MNFKLRKFFKIIIHVYKTENVTDALFGDL